MLAKNIETQNKLASVDLEVAKQRIQELEKRCLGKLFISIMLNLFIFLLSIESECLACFQMIGLETSM